MKLYLVNYHHVNSKPLKCITSLPLDEAFKLANTLHSNSPCKVHRRFGDNFFQYYEERKKAEKWLYDSFQKLGGMPKVKHPIYFTLQSCEEMSSNFGEYQKIELDLSQIDEMDISFTLGDSMALYYREELNHMLTKNQLMDLLEQKNKDMRQYWDDIRELYGFIEAQLWNDKYYTE